MKDYHVVWEINLDAESPEEAAKLAWQYMREPDSVTSIFDVTDEDGLKEQIDVLFL